SARENSRPRSPRRARESRCDKPVRAWYVGVPSRSGPSRQRGGLIMRHLLLILFVLTLTWLPARESGADIIYTFGTVSPAPLAGPVSGSFVVSDSAILDGFITAAEIRSFDFRLPQAASPFVPATFARPDALTIFSPFAGAISVNPVTGLFQADSDIVV